jgi:NitT/TauT family transport system substrate-binding protein
MTSFTRRGFLRFSALPAAAWALGPTVGFRPARAQGATVVKFASVGGITDAPLYLAEEYGLFAKANLKVERQTMASAPTLMTAVATGQLDAAGISITPGLFSSVQQGLNMRIVGDKQSLRPGVSATRMVIRTDLDQGSEAANMAALKGKAIAVSAKASSVYMLLEQLLKKHGMTFADVRVVELAYPNMLPALTSKAIDGAVSLEPFLSSTLAAGAAKAVHDLTEFVPPTGATIVPIVYSEGFAQRTGPANAFMIAYTQGVRIYNDAMFKGKDRDKTIEVIARHANIKPEVMRQSFPAGLDPDQRVNVGFLNNLQNFFVEQHFLRSPIEVTKVVDLSFADAAVKQLGAYH